MYFPTMKLVFSIEMHKRGGWENSHVCLMKRTAPWQIGTLKYFEIEIKYQPSGAGGTRSPPATAHRLQNPKWPLGSPEMADGV